MVTQVQALSKVLKTKDISLFINNNLTSDFFFNYKAQYDFIINHYKTYGQVPDVETFLKTFPDFDIVNDVEESDEYLTKDLHEGRDQVILANKLNDVRSSLLRGDVDSAKSLLVNTINLLNSNTTLDAVNVLESVESRYEEYVDKCEDYKKYYISTGFKELDRIIGGWDLQNDYSCIIARPGVGKSWCALKSVAAAIDRGLRVGLYSGEMTVNKVSYRFDTLMSHISNTKLVRGNANIALEYKNYLDNLKNKNGQLWVITPDMIPGDPTVDALESFIDKYKLEILFVDQQTLLVDSMKARMAYDRAANISKALKMLQVRKRIPIITVTQQNRSSTEDGKAGTENVAGSDRIAQDCTTVISVTKEDDLMKLHIVKARDGGTGRTLSYQVDLDHGTWEYVPNEDDGLFTDNDEDELYTPKFEASQEEGDVF